MCSHIKLTQKKAPAAASN